MHIVDAILFCDRHKSHVCGTMFVWIEWRLNGGTGKFKCKIHCESGHILIWPNCAKFWFLVFHQVLTYVAEVTQPQFRGMLAATGTTCVITGIFVQFVLMKILDSWRQVAMLCIALPLVTIVALCFVPESPYWLLTKGRIDDARNSLAWLRGWVPFANVKHEFDEIHHVLINKKKESDALASMSFMHRWKPYTRQSFLAPFALVSATFFFGHFSGKTPLQTYAVQVTNSQNSIPILDEVENDRNEFLSIFGFFFAEIDFPHVESANR